MQIVQLRRERVNKVRARGGVLGVTTVDGVSSESWRVAKIFHTAAAIRTITVDSAHPGNADARAKRQFIGSALHNFTHDLMARNERSLPRRQLSFSDMQIGTAHSAGANAKQDLTWTCLGLRNLFDLKRMFRSFENGGFHRVVTHTL